MAKPVIILTGCDANFYPFMEEALKSLLALHLEDHADIGVLDLGLAPDQLSTLQTLGATIKQPTWSLNVPQEQRKSYMVGLVARTTLRDDFPGYQVYLWFDADAWAQTPEFFTKLVAGARANGVAIIRENGTGYHRDWLYNRWWYGHMIKSYGISNGLRVAYKPAINIGIVALKDDAPHWQAWRTDYQHMIDRRGKINLDQHAFNAMIELRGLTSHEVPPSCNWICTLSPPYWNPQSNQFCEPNVTAKPLSVLHLAGPHKRRDYRLHVTTGGEITTPVTYEAFLALKNGSPLRSTSVS